MRQGLIAGGGRESHMFLTLVALPVLVVLPFALAVAKRGRSTLPASDSEQQAIHVLLVAHLAHVLETWLTDASSRLPAIYGEAPMPTGALLVAGLACYVVCGVACYSLFERRAPWALWPLVALALASGPFSAILHCVWSWRQGGYAPGLLTAQLHWYVGYRALVRLGIRRLTALKLCGLSLGLGLPALLMQT